MKLLLPLLIFISVFPLAKAQTLIAVKKTDGLSPMSHVHSALAAEGINTESLVAVSKRLGIYEVGESLSVAQMQRLRLEKSIAEISPNTTLSLLKPANVQNLESGDYQGLWGIQNRAREDQDKLKGVLGVDVSAEKAWELEKGSETVIVGVVDSGIDVDHPQLVSSIWTNLKEAQGRAGLDDDGNGYVDDIHGYDFVNNKPNGDDDLGHGTHVAGTIAAQKGSNGHQGMAPRAKVMALKVFNDRGQGKLKTLVQAADYALEKGVRIFNHSWGVYREKDFIREVFSRMGEKGVLNVVAAGNNGQSLNSSTLYPAALPLPSILGVAAADHAGNMAWYSSWDEKLIEVAAPGHRILSTFKGGGYKQLSGTSMASPHVAGIAALLLSHYPEWSAQQVKKRLMKTVKPLPSLEKVTRSAGLVSAYHALTGERPPSPIEDFSTWKRKEINVESRHPYWNDSDEKLEVRVPGAQKMVVFFERFALHDSDKVKFTGPGGGWWSKPELFGVWKNDFEGRYSPIAHGDTMVIKLEASFSHNDYGFRASHVLWK